MHMKSREAAPASVFRSPVQPLGFSYMSYRLDAGVTTVDSDVLTVYVGRSR